MVDSCEDALWVSGRYLVPEFLSRLPDCHAGYQCLPLMLPLSQFHRLISPGWSDSPTAGRGLQLVIKVLAVGRRERGNQEDIMEESRKEVASLRSHVEKCIWWLGPRNKA